MNRAVSYELESLFQSSVIGDTDTVLVNHDGTLFVGVILGPVTNGFGDWEVQWFTPTNNRKGYRTDTSFVPTKTKSGKVIADFVWSRNMYCVNWYVQERTDEKIQFKMPFPKIRLELDYLAMMDEETLSDDEFSRNQFDGDSDGDSDFDAPTPVETPKKRKREEEESETVVPRKRGGSDPYNDDLKQYDCYKRDINMDLANMAHMASRFCKVDPREMGTPACLYLDGKHARTTATLLDAGLRSEDLYCPNLYEDTVTSIRAATNGLINTSRESIQQFTRQHHPRKFCFAWIDATGTWQPNNDLTVREAVLNLFEYKLLATHSVVAWTCSIHAKSGPQEERVKSDVAAHFEEIKAFIEEKGFRYTLETPSIHHVTSQRGDLPNCGQMYTAYMRVWK